MVTPQLIDYIKQELARGTSREMIHESLMSAGGWNSENIEEAFVSLMPTPMSAEGVPVAPIKYAGFWIRFVANLIDGLIIAIPSWIVQSGFIFLFVGMPSLTSPYGKGSIGLSAAAYFIGLIVPWTYFSLMTYYTGATLGKKCLGITVKSDDFEKLSFGRVLLRETVGKLLSTLIIFIGYIMAAFTQKKQTLHDMCAKSVVVYKDPTKQNTGAVVAIIIVASLFFGIIIIGILSSVVLASLSTARAKGQEAIVQSQLASIRYEVELYSSTHNDSYSTASDCTSGVFASDGVKQILTKMQANDTVCYAEGSTFAIAATTPSQHNYCIDNGKASVIEGVATDTNGSAACQEDTSQHTASSTASSTSATAPLTGKAYSYTLPSSWQSANNSKQGIQAVDATHKYVLSVTTIPIPASAGKISSIKELISENNAKEVVQDEFPGAKVNKVSSGFVDKEDATIISFSASVPGSSPTAPQKQISVLQYSMVHNGTVYTVLFIMSASAGQASTISDFQSIIKSFTFTK